MQGTTLTQLVALMTPQGGGILPVTPIPNTQPKQQEESNKQTTSQSIVTTASPSMFTQSDIDQAAGNVQQAARTYNAVAQVGAEQGRNAVGNIIKEAEVAKQRVGEAKDSAIARFGTELDQQLAINQRTAKTLKELESYIDDPETKATQRLANENLQAASMKVIEAQEQIRNGGFLDKLAGIFKADIYGSQLNKAQNVAQGVNAQQAQLVQQYMNQLQADAAIAGSPYADTLARQDYITKEATTLYEKAVNNIAIDMQSMDALGKSLDLSSEEVKALTTELNAIVTANNANQSLIAAKIQEASLNSMMRKEQQEIQKSKDEEAFFAYRQQQFDSFLNERGLEGNGLTYKSMLAASQTEGPIGGTPDILDAFLAHVNSVESRPKSALSRYAYAIEAQQEPDMVAINAKSFYEAERNRSVKRIKAEEVAKWKERQPENSALQAPAINSPEWEEMQRAIKQRTDEITMYNEDGTVNPKALAYWDKQYAANIATINEDATNAIRDGLVTFHGVELNRNSPDFMQRVKNLLPPDTVKALEGGLNVPLNIDQTSNPGSNLASNMKALFGNMAASGTLFDNAASMQTIDHAAKYMAAMYKVHRQTQRESMPNMIRTVVKVTDFGSISEINLEDEQSLKLALQYTMLKTRAEEQFKRGSGISVGPTGAMQSGSISQTLFGNKQ